MLPPRQAFKDQVGEELRHYFEANHGSVSSPNILREAGKATSRGFAKSRLEHKRQQQDSQLTHLEAQAALIETQPREGRSEAQVRRLAFLRDEIPQAFLEAAKLLWRSSVARMYGWGDENVKLLHWLATYPMANRIIPEMLHANGAIHQTPAGVAHCFADYCTTLYTAQPPSLSLTELLQHGRFSLPRLTEPETQTLDLPVTRGDQR